VHLSVRTVTGQGTDPERGHTAHAVADRAAESVIGAPPNGASTAS
jgi:hypothetical protein